MVSDVLEEQMTEMKKGAEKKLSELKSDQTRVDKELYDMKNSMADVGVTAAATSNTSVSKASGQTRYCGLHDVNGVQS